MTDPIEFALLGPLAATRAGRPLDLGPRRQCAVLSMLLSQPNKIVHAEALLRGVWDDELPASGPRLISTYVYRLRRVLGADGDTVLERPRGGYRLRTDSGGLDTARFTAAVERAREQRTGGRVRDARTSLDAALALWRGEPFAGLPGPVLAAERVRLDEERLAALELRAELELCCGKGDLGAGELRALRDRYPLRERLAALLMVALYRNGRQAEALSVFTETGARLRDELGVRPGRDLAAVHLAVVRGDDAALGDIGGTGGGERPAARPAGRRDDLPAAPPQFAGRTREIELLVPAGGQQRPPASVVAVDGMPGVGKTALVLEAATRLRSRHPGGRFYLDLQAHRPGRTPMHPDEALRRLLVAAGHVAGGLPGSVDERSALWRDTVAGRGALLVLDDVDCTDQVRPLLPSAPGCTVLVAGRRRLTALPATTALSLAPLDLAAGRDLLAGVVGDERVAAEPDEVRALVAACGGLPTLLTGIAGRLRHRPALTFAEMLTRLGRPGGLLRIVPPDARGLDTVLDPSWLRLGVSEQAALRSLAAGGEAGTADVMEALSDANLVEEPRPGTYRVHPLVAAYVSEQLASSQVRVGSVAG